jgi:stress response protein SCP2
MPINLTKGQTINLDKKSNDLTEVTIGLGWKIKSKTGFLSKLMSAGSEYDLDAIAFLLDENDKVCQIGDQRLVGGDVVFFNNLVHPSGAVRHSGDNLVGGTGAQDDEQIVVKLDKIPKVYHRLVFIVAIYQGQQKKQHFGEVEKAFMRAVDGKGQEIARYNLADDTAYTGMCSMIFGELYRKDDGWKFRAVGDAFPEDSLIPLLRRHLP